MPIIFSASDVKKILKIGNDTVYAIFKSKDFPSFKVGKAYKVRKEDFIKWLDEQKALENKIKKHTAA